MEGLKNRIDSAVLTQDEIATFITMLKRKRRALEQNLLEERRTRLLNQPVPKEWLELAYKDYVKYLENDADSDNDPNDSDEDVLAECFQETAEGVELDLYATLKQKKIHCKRSTCWYDENPDRRGEHRYNYYHILDPTKFYCDVCFADYGKTTVDGTAANHFLPQFLAYVRDKKANKKLKIV